jgi:hypothetical protein
MTRRAELARRGSGVTVSRPFREPFSCNDLGWRVVMRPSPKGLIVNEAVIKRWSAIGQKLLPGQLFSCGRLLECPASLPLGEVLSDNDGLRWKTVK